MTATITRMRERELRDWQSQLRNWADRYQMFRGIYPGERPPQFACAPLQRPDIEWLLSVREGAKPILAAGGTFAADCDLSRLDLQGAVLHWARLPTTGLVRGANLMDAHLFSAQLQDAYLSGVRLDGADLSLGQLQKARLVGCQFRGASLSGADLGGAKLWRCHLEQVDLRGANLVGADLTEAQFDNQTDLGDVRFFTSSGRGGPSVVDVHWNEVQITKIADLEVGKQLGDDPCPDWPLRPVAWVTLLLSRSWKSLRSLWGGGSVEATTVLTPQIEMGPWLSDAQRLRLAVRAYRQLAVLLKIQGIAGPARRFEYRANRLERKTASGLGRLLSFVYDILSGYGFKPIRLVIAYLATVTVFASVYDVLGVVKGPSAFWFSIIAFHGRGVVSGVDIGVGSSGLIVAAIEAAVGVLIEALLVAAIVRRAYPG